MVLVDNVELVNIDERLQQLWDEELGKKRVRACFYTLLIYTKKNSEDYHYQTLIQSVVSKLPSRVIWIRENENSFQNDYLRTQVSTETFSEESFCEIIEIEVGGKYVERVPFIVLPHLLPDLPIYLLWTEEPTAENFLLAELQKLSRKIIFGVIPIKNLNHYTKAVYDVFLQKKPLGDLQWASLNGWRHLLNLTFDTHSDLNALQNARSIKFIYFQTPHLAKHSMVRAALLQAWMASNLGWKFESIEHKDDTKILSYKSSSRKVIIGLTPQDSDIKNLPPGAILSIQIESSSNSAEYSYKRVANARQVCIQYSDASHCDLPHYHNVPGAPEGKEIIEEIFYSSEHKHYKKTLELMVQIPW